MPGNKGPTPPLAGWIGWNWTWWVPRRLLGKGRGRRWSMRPLLGLLSSPGAGMGSSDGGGGGDDGGDRRLLP
ncbi:uncharacterized protein HKW66_Vig0025440 [Vigna angularis]|uniref:Uncharacterized protein n=1 Tax=Phaseolus angularis TaxID=3914 RepID=A0A8T0L820_PHAAN|nr:uncharacterized protein HKW66_Vig0025440 [Vigna angularis]